MMNEEKIEKLDPSMFEFVQSEGMIHDKKLDTKPIGYFKDALLRFKKNRSSVISFVILVIMVLFAILGPFISKYSTTDVDGYYKLSLPKSTLFSWAGWNGCSKKSVSQDGYDSLRGIFYEELEEGSKNVNSKPIVKDYGSSVDSLGITSHSVYVDSYYSVGFQYINLSTYEYYKLQAYQDATNIQVIYPSPAFYFSDTNANNWYVTTDFDKAQYAQYNDLQQDLYSTQAVCDDEGNFIPNYKGNTRFNAVDYYSKRLKGEYNLAEDGTRTGNYTYTTYDSIKLNKNTGAYTKKNPQEHTGYYQYAVANQTGFQVRVLYYEYYKFSKTTITYDGNKDDSAAKEVFNTDYSQYSDTKTYAYDSEDRVNGMTSVIKKFKVGNDGFYCSYLFGSNDKGKDIFVMLSSGARLSFILAIAVSLINLTIGAIYGAIEGYYGGAADLIMERVSDILNEVPFIVVATLFKLHLAEKVGAVVSLLFAFVLTGWIGMASRTRMQFYRFKGQEYVLSARTLGAKDFRIMFKHIFPNAIGTLITGSVLSIPGVIFSESSLSYLHIIDLETSGFTSVGTLLSNGTSYVNTYPHVVLFPAIFIALLMISFNLLGNGLRDAFNPSLRGVDE